MTNAKKHENVTHTQEKEQAIKTTSESIQMSDLMDKDFKISIISMFRKLKETMPNELQERMMKRSCQIENINKGKEIIFYI